ncbi:MAG: hypothetical protein K6A69_00755 [Lachnospiraceae bacterium]|nr:hypothetical protein [Lachnospiraceae bacterium]
MIDFSKCRYKSEHCPDISKIEEKAENNSQMSDIFLITLSDKTDELLTIYPYSILRQDYYHDKEQAAVGAAKGYKEALSLTESIINDVLRSSGTIGREQICQYFS